MCKKNKSILMENVKFLLPNNLDNNSLSIVSENTKIDNFEGIVGFLNNRGAFIAINNMRAFDDELFFPEVSIYEAIQALIPDEMIYIAEIDKIVPNFYCDGRKVIENEKIKAIPKGMRFDEKGNFEPIPDLSFRDMFKNIPLSIADAGDALMREGK